MEKEKILIVEDEIIIARDTESRLKKIGYNVTGIAETHEETLTLIEKETPDLILMDIKIRGQVDGISSAIEIWERFKIPVIFLTAYSDDVTLARARLSNFYGFLIKPIKENEFKIAVENALYKAHGDSLMKLSADYFLSILENLTLGIIASDNDNFIVYMNEKACSWLELTEEPVGLNINEVFVKTGEPKEEPDEFLKKSVQLILKGGKKINAFYGIYNINWKNERMGTVIQFIKTKACG